ncbi:MAG: CPBP family intramembrane metalloprotease [Lachnospiraceae bacterium]|nr:CPBP family intramembrane metalloprotease [Lachnospiraceae bacterium]
MNGNDTARHWIYGILITLLIGSSYCVFSNFLIRIAGIPDVSLVGNDPVSLMERDSLTMMILLEVLIAPVIEELLFRKLFYGNLRMRMGWVPAALIVSAVFAILHLNIAQAVYAFVFSLILCEIAERTANWYLCVSAHVSANVCAILSAQLEPWNALLLSRPAVTVILAGALLLAGLLLLVLFERRITAFQKHW